MRFLTAAAPSSVPAFQRPGSSLTLAAPCVCECSSPSGVKWARWTQFFDEKQLCGCRTPPPVRTGRGQPPRNCRDCVQVH